MMMMMKMMMMMMMMNYYAFLQLTAAKGDILLTYS